MTDLFAKINNIKICYDIHGQGDPVFLIHGFSDRKEHWRAQVDKLAKNFKVIRMDNRGAGKSEKPKNKYTIEVYAHDIAGLMDYLNIEKAHVVGHSLGGMIAQNFALLYPEKLNKLVLVNTIPGLRPPGEDITNAVKMYKQNAINGLKAREKDPLNAFLTGAKSSYSRKFWKLMREDPDRKFHGIWSVNDLLEEKTKYGPTEQDLIHQSDALASHNTYHSLPNIKSEVLIIAAEKDKSCPASMSEKMHELIPNSKMVIIEKAAHQSILEKPQEVNSKIIEFLKD
ncbi:MAG: alpha/beta fold hydrolase [Candidatus Lokiarchaeota archaeon]|nr:alpha/beta fold hydrolase [Candidatus Lokiarchaeota archaeon]MBD3342327.1 alpha/beta fold hydrolase [Candidatus Lokiarchaeota archaeon]